MRPWVLVVVGFLAGGQMVMLLPDRWLVAPEAPSTPEVWACPMMCVRMSKPGRCPVCDMPLERIEVSGDQVIVPADQAKAIGLGTAKVERRTLMKPIRAVGTIDSSVRRIPGDPLGGKSEPRSAFSVRFEVYDAELPWLALGQPAEVTLDARPGDVMKGTVENIGGAVSQQTHSTRVRVAVEARSGRRALGTIARVTVYATLGADGRPVAQSLAGRYTCRDHPDVHADAPGECPVCKLPLELDPHARADAKYKVLAVPRDSVLSLGRKHMAYVLVRPGVYEPRRISIGPRADDFVMVLEGLKDGEEVARGGAFLLDSQLQLAGKKSLLSR